MTSLRVFLVRFLNTEYRIPNTETFIEFEFRDTGQSVSSLGWVTPAAATEGVALYFFLKNLATFLVASSAVSPLFIFS